MPQCRTRRESRVKILDLPLADLKLIELQVHGDARGFFVERFHEKRFEEAGLPIRYVQDNHSRSGPCPTTRNR